MAADRTKTKCRNATIAGMTLVVLAALLFVSRPVSALTTASSTISFAAATFSAVNGTGGATVTVASNIAAPVTVLPVSGVKWNAVPSAVSLDAGATRMLYYEFAHVGNIGGAPAKDNFYVAISGSWIEGVYTDAAGTQRAVGDLFASLSPNTANTYGFYVRVAPPANVEGQSSNVRVEVQNEYFHANGANDLYGEPDRILSDVIVNPPRIGPTVAITAPAQSAEITGDYAILGTATDANFVDYAVYYGTGTAPMKWALAVATTTTKVQSGTLGIWTASRLTGDYTLRLAARDQSGNISETTRQVRVVNWQPVAGTIPVDQWTMVAIPGDTATKRVVDLLGSSRYEAQWWDPSITVDDPYLYKYRRRDEIIVQPGQAFWVKPYDTPIVYNVPAKVVNTAEDFRIHLAGGWNQVGLPFNREIAWGQFRFIPDGSTTEIPLCGSAPVASAVSQGLVNQTFHSYGTTGFVSNDCSAVMAPMRGYFVKANSPGTLIVNPGAGTLTGLARVIRPVYAWRLQVEAVAADSRDTDNYAGELRGAAEEFDPADSAEPPPVEPYVQVYFPHEDWPKSAGRYTADIRAAQDAAETPKEKTWTFVVRTSVPATSVTLEWPGAGALPENYDIRVRDLADGKELDPKAQPDYRFTTDASGTRNFAIVARRNEQLAKETSLAVTIPAGWSLISVPLETTDTDIRFQLGDALKKLTVYQYYDRKLYDPESADRVDIQAGVAYWTHAETPVNVAFHGRPIPLDQTVDVPLADGWNLIGNPYQTEINYGDNLRVSCGNDTETLGEAARRGWISARLYRYDDQKGGYTAMEPGDRMSPWLGYLIKGVGSCALRMHP